MTPAEHRAFKARLLRAFMANKDKLGLGDDEQVLIAYRALLAAPSIRNSQWLHDALRGEEPRLDG